MEFAKNKGWSRGKRSCCLLCWPLGRVLAMGAAPLPRGGPSKHSQLLPWGSPASCRRGSHGAPKHNTWTWRCLPCVFRNAKPRSFKEGRERHSQWKKGPRGSSTLGLASQISPCLSARTLSSVCSHSHSGLGNTAPSWQAWPQVWTPAQLFSRLLWHGGEQAEAPRRNFTNQRKWPNARWGK